MQFLLNLNINDYYILNVIWNIFLALIPCFIIYHLIQHTGRRSWHKLKGERFAFILLFLFWLLFFPNTAYLFTIPRHLVDYCSNFDDYRVCANGTWQVIFFFTYAAIGIPTFYYALKKMSKLFKIVFNKSFEKLLPILVIPLTSIGLIFGLYERFNTWDIVSHPTLILKTFFGYFSDKIMLTDFVIFTVILYLIYYLTDWLIELKIE